MTASGRARFARRSTEVLAWIVLLPGVLAAVTHAEVAQLLLGAFGPPAQTTLQRWLVIGLLAAGTAALLGRTGRGTDGVRRRPPVRHWLLIAAGCAGIIVVRWQSRGISRTDVTFPGPQLSIGATVYQPRGPGKHPAIVIVPGSAPLKRGFYSLWAERLARLGFVVIVPDKRGVGGTGGEFERENNSSQANLELLAQDAAAALDYAAHQPAVDTARVGLLGLSQAGWVAPLAAATSPHARFLVLISGPTVSVREEGVWSDLRGDQERGARVSRAEAEQVMDTTEPGGVDARPVLGGLNLPGLWLFGMDDNSIPSAHSAAVIDSLARIGKPFTADTFASASHLLFTRRGSWLPHTSPDAWRSLEQWLRKNLLVGD